jgi:hypothetical protein
VRGRVLDKATDTRERVERAFDDRITSALTRLGIPSQRDLDQINDRLETLTDLMQDISRTMRSDLLGNDKDA